MPEALEELDRRIKTFYFKATEISLSAYAHNPQKKHNTIVPINKTKPHEQDELMDRVEMWISKCSLKQYIPSMRNKKLTNSRYDRSYTKYTPLRRTASMESICLPSIDSARKTTQAPRSKHKSFTLNSKSLKEFKFAAANAKKSTSRSTSSLNIPKNRIERNLRISDDDECSSNSSETEKSYSAHSDNKINNETIEEHKQKKRTFLLNLLSRKSKRSLKDGNNLKKAKKYDAKSKSSSSLAPSSKKDEVLSKNLKNELKTKKRPSILQKEMIAISAPDISRLIYEKGSIDSLSLNHTNLEGRHSWVGPQLNKNIVYIDEIF